MDDARRGLLANVAKEFGTPCYVYFLDDIRRRFEELSAAFSDRFRVSYAVKANPNPSILRAIQEHADGLDVSSIGEVDRALEVGCPAERLTFSGPAKRRVELERALELGVGEIVCESLAEIEILEDAARQRGVRCRILLRINPSRMPKGFGINMAGKPSQFGIDEEDLDHVIAQLNRYSSVEVEGFHIYSGTNALSEPAIAENFEIFLRIFSAAARSLGRPPRRLIFGAGFGIPYYPTQQALDLGKLAELVNPLVDAMQEDSMLREAECVLEMGRWLVGPAGYLLLSVIGAKRSRGTEIRLCDAGFNNHLAACGMMGTIVRRNWNIWKVTPSSTERTEKYLLVGPLCTTIDTLATDIELPELTTGDVLAIGASGAYGLTSSPTRFISHPEPREVVVDHHRESGEYQAVPV